MTRHRALCAFCVERLADTITDYDGRPVVACWPCLSPVPEPAYYEPADIADRFNPSATSPGEFARTAARAAGGRWVAGSSDAVGSTRAAVLAVVRRLGEATADQIATELRAPWPGANAPRELVRPYNAILKCLCRAVKSGLVEAEWRMPGAPSAGRIYRVRAA